MTQSQEWSWLTPGGYDQALNNATPDESVCLRLATTHLRGTEPTHKRAATLATLWIEALRSQTPSALSLENLLQSYPISSVEGLAMMRLAEALTRIPDETTARLLIADKLAQGNWAQHGAATQGLLAWSDRALEWAAKTEQQWLEQTQHNWWHKLKDKSVRFAAMQALHRMGQQFVAGENITQATRTLAGTLKQPDCASYDMLGEGARCRSDAKAHFDGYFHCIEQLAGSEAGISIKLSALHPRFEESQRQRVLKELVPEVFALACECAGRQLSLTVDAEESDRLVLTLDVLEATHRLLAKHPEETVRAWQGFGVAVQAYQKRALTVVEVLLQHAKDTGRKWQIRLVKGAYWDTEITRAQQQGLGNYPVLTTRAATDMNYLACARFLMQQRKWLYPMFGTHNAMTLACVLAYSNRSADTPQQPFDFECQRLYGMGDALWEQVRKDPRYVHLPCRVYAPVGPHSDALSYLIRRLMENAANTSFVYQTHQAQAPTQSLTQDPLEICSLRMFAPSEQIANPPDIYQHRKNATGYPLHNRDVQRWVRSSLNNSAALLSHWHQVAQTQTQYSEVLTPLRAAKSAYPAWRACDIETRCSLLNAWANQIETRAHEALALLVEESHKTIRDAFGEIRESVDFLRYYAAQARELFSHPQTLKGPFGERNTLHYHPRGVWLCISPWNFPLAILTGQIAAALVCGNTVLAKPAEQSTAIAAWLVHQAQEAGLPQGVLTLLNARRETMAEVIANPAVAGLSFTGSLHTAKRIEQQLALRTGAMIPFIAETGGMNVMVVDSSALLEQSCDHILESAFNQAGQRCSALRILYVQKEVAPRLLELLGGALAELNIGQTQFLETDIGPLIDHAAKEKLMAQWEHLKTLGKVLVEPSMAQGTEGQAWFTPAIIEMQTPYHQEELFGPVLQVVLYEAQDFDQVLEQISEMPWGLTLGLQSRIDERIEKMADLPVGNFYVNRPMIGATVGVQPFGGQGTSGTGPKAGGPNTLKAHCTERVVSINTAASGATVELLTLPVDSLKIGNRFDADL